MACVPTKALNGSGIKEKSGSRWNYAAATQMLTWNMKQTPRFAFSFTLFDLFRLAALKATNKQLVCAVLPLFRCTSSVCAWMLLINTAVRLGFGFQWLMQLRSSVWTHSSLPKTPSMPLLHFLSCIIFRDFQKALSITRTHVQTLFPGTSELVTSWFWSHLTCLMAPSGETREKWGVSEKQGKKK